MAKNVYSKMKSKHPAALAILGWLAFVSALIVKPIGLKLVLLSAARVLPEVLSHRRIAWKLSKRVGIWYGDSGHAVAGEDRPAFPPAGSLLPEHTVIVSLARTALPATRTSQG